jgi:hypothetical protein
MADVNGNPGYTQLEKLNITDELLVKGLPVGGASGRFAENVVIINDVSELDVYESGGKYILDGMTVYDFSALNGITIPYAFDVSAGGIVIKAETALYAMLTYLGTDDLFTGPNLDIRNIAIVAPSSNVFNLTRTGSGGDYFLCNTLLIAFAAKWGTFELDDLNIINSGSIDVQQGITLNGANWNTTRTDGLNLQSSNPAFVGLDFSAAVLSDPKFDSVVMNAPVGSVGINSNGNTDIQPNEICSYTNGNFSGGITPLAGGVTVGDIRFDFSSNGGLEDSIIAANPYLVTQTTVPIVSTNTFVKINQGNWLSSISERLSVSVDGDVENVSEQPIRIDFTGFVTMEKAGGGSDYIVARLVLNDTPGDAASVITENGTENSQPTSVPLVGIFTLQPGDSVSIYVANTDGTSDIIVTNAKFTNFRLR